LIAGAVLGEIHPGPGTLAFVVCRRAAAAAAVTGLSAPSRAGARLGPELEDDVDRGLGDLPEPAEAGVPGQLPYRCGAGLGAERDPPCWARAAGVHWNVDAA
jgi:hypothetical protein